MANGNSNGSIDEETPLLQAKAKTPLPKTQIAIVLFVLTSEPISSAYIFPFINQLIRELGVTGGDDRKIGYYAGLIESLFFLTQAATILQWSRLSDYIGRKPVILIGLLGLSISNISFGLSRTLETLIVSRCIAGLLNGNVGVMKSIIGEITDHTNMTQAFALVAPVFCIGLTIAPLFGGTLARPQDHWPQLFAGAFWDTYPYFLPCIVSSMFSLVAFCIAALFLKESLPSKRGLKQRTSSTDTLVVENLQEHSLDTTDMQPMPLMTLLTTYSVMIPIANYGMLALIEMLFLALLPLFYATPTEFGGLGFPPSIIGTWLAAFGILDGVIQALFVAKIVDRIGAKNLFGWAILCFYPLTAIFPIMSAFVETQGGVGPVIWVLLALQLIFLVLMDMSYSVIFVFTTRASPNKHSLGTTNGLSQTLASIARAIGPAMSTSLFAFSKEKNVLGGNLVYVILAILTTGLVLLSFRLPDLRDEE